MNQQFLQTKDGQKLQVRFLELRKKPGPIHEAEEKEGREAKRERMALRW